MSPICSLSLRYSCIAQWSVGPGEKLGIRQAHLKRKKKREKGRHSMAITSMLSRFDENSGEIVAGIALGRQLLYVGLQNGKVLVE